MGVDSSVVRPAARPGASGRDTIPYLVLAGALTVLMVVHTLNRGWSTDYWVHQATVETFRQDLFDPVNELTHSADPSFSYTPYSFVLAVVARSSGWASVTVLQAAAIANLVLFLVTFRGFVDELTHRRRAAFFALLATLVLWGIGPWRWSGLLNLNALGFGLPFPSMFATAVAFGVGWALLRYDDTGSRWWVATVGAGMVTIALTHPFTSVWTLVMLVALAVHRRLYRRDRIGPLVVAAGAGAAVVLLWPYYSFVDLMTEGETFGGLHDALYERIAIRLVAAGPGFVIVVRRFQRDRTDPLALMLIGAVLLYAFGAITGDHNFGRVLPLVLLPAHIAIGVLLSDITRHGARPRPVLVGSIVVAAVIGVAGIVPGLGRAIPRALLPASIDEREAYRPITEPYDGLAGALGPDATVVAEGSELSAIAPAYGIGVLASSRPTPFVPDTEARQRASAQFFTSAFSDADRRELFEEYDLDGVLCATDACAATFTSPAASDGAPWGEVVARGPSWTLIRPVDKSPN